MVGFGVDENAPRWPFVIPTLLYRNLLLPLPFWNPLCRLFAWAWRMLYDFFSEDEVSTARISATETVRKASTRMVQQARVKETFEPDIKISDDEVIY